VEAQPSIPLAQPDVPERGATPKLYLVGVISAPTVTAAIIVGNLLVYYFFLSNYNSVNPLLNTWSNFPWGVFTAIFAPDTNVLLCYTGNFTPASCFQNFVGWFGLNAGILVSYLAFLFLVNIDCNSRKLASRVSFYAIALIMISVLSNFLALLRSAGSVGPSTAGFAGIGVVLGFGAANTAAWVKEGHEITGIRNLVAVVFSILVILITVLSISTDPTAYFNVATGIDWIAHVFCFVAGGIVALVWVLLQRRFSERDAIPL
jgi:hypothetical protein